MWILLEWVTWYGIKYDEVFLTISNDWYVNVEDWLRWIRLMFLLTLLKLNDGP